MSNEIKIIFADWNFILFNQIYLYLFYLAQTLMIFYFAVKLYPKGDIMFVQYIRELMSANDFKDKSHISSYIEGIKNLLKYDNKQNSISQKLQNIAFIVMNLLQILQLFMGKKKLLLATQFVEF